MPTKIIRHADLGDLAGLLDRGDGDFFGATSSVDWEIQKRVLTALAEKADLESGDEIEKIEVREIKRSENAGLGGVEFAYVVALVVGD